MGTAKAEMELHPVQAAFLDRRSLLAGFVGGRGTGKSTIGAYDLLKRAKPGRTYAVVTPTYPMLRDASLRSFMDLGRRFGFVRSFTQTDMRAILGNGAEVLFRSASEPDRLRGPNLSGTWLDEASQIKREAFDIMIASLRQGGEMGWLSATFTPNGRSHWTYQVFAKGDRAQLFRATTRENPFLPAEFHEQIRHQYSGLRAEQELEGRFVDVEGAEWPAEFFGPDIWFNAWPADPILKVAAWDPSKGRGSKFGDYSAFVTVALHRDGKFYIDAKMANDWPINVQVSMVVEIQREFGPEAFGIETNQFQELLVSDVTRASAVAGVPVPIYTIDNRVNKELRILRLTPYLSQGQLRFMGGSPGAEMLVEQMRDFSMANTPEIHDDGPDALEMAVRLLTTLTSQVDDGLGNNLLSAGRM